LGITSFAASHPVDFGEIAASRIEKPKELAEFVLKNVGCPSCVEVCPSCPDLRSARGVTGDS